MLKFSSKPEAEHAREPDRHVGIAGEIEIDLEGEEQHARPGLREAKGANVMREDQIRAAGERIGEEQLLHDAEHEARKAHDKVVDVGVRHRLELARDVVIFDDRAGEQLGKEKDVKPVKRADCAPAP